MTPSVPQGTDLHCSQARWAELATAATRLGHRRTDVVGGQLARPIAHRASTRLDRWLVRRLLQGAGNPPVGVQLWDGYQIGGGTAPPKTRLRIADRGALWGLLIYRDLYFGDAYMDGQIEVDGDLLEFLEAFYRCRHRVSSWRRRIGGWWDGWRANSRRESRKNIHHHYDIGDDFYRLWLDAELIYTCAYFPLPQATLEEAQKAKMDYVCRKLRLRPGETVVEAGCGWGALSLYMARRYGVQVKAYNISHAQVAYARRRAQAEGMAGQVEFIEDDYRSISGRFDVFVSVGMLEHVGRSGHRELGRVIQRCLGPAGRGLIHSIGQDEPIPINPWIRRRIFPGAYPPTLREMVAILEPFHFSVIDVENLRLHYAETLRHWLGRFETEAGAVTEMFGPRFVRAWRLYLAGSTAAFLTGALQLFQIVFTRGGVNDVPWTRAGLYHAVH